MRLSLSHPEAAMHQRLRIKICGVTTVEDADNAARLGADALGLNFWEGSKRHITHDAATAILRQMPPFVEPVALYVNVPLRTVFESLNGLGRIRTFQWYGQRPELCDAYPFQMIPAFAVRDKNSLAEITRYLDAAREFGKAPAAVLVEPHVAGQYGGTGQRAPWDLLAEFRIPEPLILAGGLTPENVGEAVRLVRPYAVDVAGGVESAPGRKDPEKMRRFIGNAHEAAARLTGL
jgi:phosphoribosylanthranilate isomerase